MVIVNSAINFKQQPKNSAVGGGFDLLPLFWFFGTALVVFKRFRGDMYELKNSTVFLVNVVLMIFLA